MCTHRSDCACGGRSRTAKVFNQYAVVTRNRLALPFPGLRQWVLPPPTHHIIVQKSSWQPSTLSVYAEIMVVLNKSIPLEFRFCLPHCFTASNVFAAPLKSKVTRQQSCCWCLRHLSFDTFFSLPSFPPPLSSSLSPRWERNVRDTCVTLTLIYPPAQAHLKESVPTVSV